LYYATDGFKSGTYSAVVESGMNPYRWIEYAASASFMIVLIAYELGIKDANHLLTLVFVNIAMQTCGFLVENALVQPSIDRTTVKGATLIGWLLLVGMWLPIIITFVTLVNDINTNYDGLIDETGDKKKIRIPGFVYFIIIFQIINFTSFGFIQAGQIRDALSGNPKPFGFYERRYLKLSFIGKLALASGLAYGLLFRVRDCP
jgi:hypothetical protein